MIFQSFKKAALFMNKPDHTRTENRIVPRHHAVALLLLILLIFTVYSNTFDAGWHLDDNTNIINREAIHLSSLDWSSLNKTFIADSGDKLYRPVVCFTLALNWYLGQDKTIGYHWVNLMVHCIAACFLYLVLYHVMLIPASIRPPNNDIQFVALLGAALWAINPMQIQAVTYIVQRMASMTGMFYIMALYFYLRFRSASRLKNRLIFLVACTAAALLAVGSKQNAWTLPAALFLAEVLMVRGSRKIGPKAIFFFGVSVATALLVAVFFLNLELKQLLTKGYEARAFSLTERLLTEPRILTFHLSQLFYPTPDRFSIAHDFPLSTSLLSPISTGLSILFLVSLLIAGLFLTRKHPLAAFAIFFFFLNHLIESTIIPLELVFEHRNYLPSMFLFAPLALFLYRALDRWHRKTVVHVSLCVLVTGLVITIGHATYLRNADWKTETSLWTAAVEKAPGIWRPWHSLGHDYAMRNRPREAIALFRTALEKKATVNKNDKYLTHYSLGNQYHLLKDYPRALYQYEQTALVNKNFAGVLNNKAAVMVDLGRITEARQLFFLAALNDYSGRPKALSNLGYLMLKDNLIQEALAYLEAAHAETPRDTLTLTRLGYAYTQNGQLGKALLLFRKANAIEPFNLITQLYLADVYEQAGMHGRKEKAMLAFIDAITVNDLDKLLCEKADADQKYHSILLDGSRFLRLMSVALPHKHGFTTWARE
jgi:Tfp pilus assembly protein PilF